MKKNNEILTSTNKHLIKRFWFDFISRYKIDIFIAFLLLIIVAVTASIYPYLIQLVFDGLLDSNKTEWITIPAIIAFIAIIRGISMYFQIKQVSKISLSLAVDIQKKLTKHLINSDLAELNKLSSGNHVSRIMNDVVLIKDGIERSINNLIRDTLTILVLMGYLFWIDWLLSILVFVIYPIALKPILKIGKKQNIIATSLQQQMEMVTSTLTEMLQGIRMIRAYNLEKIEFKRSEGVFNSLFQKMFSLVMGRAKVLPILEVLGGVAAACVIGLASYRVSLGQLSPGSVVGFVTALLMLAQPARALGTFNTVAQEGLSALRRIYSQLDILPKVISISTAPDLIITTQKPPSISFENVSYSYNNKSKTLSNINFFVKGGSKVALVGQSGAGKSTIINLIPRFYDPTLGQINIDNQNIKEINVLSLRNKIALVSQETIIYNKSFIENIRFGKLEAEEKEIIQAAKSAGIDKFIMSTSDGYNTILGESGNKLSGGQRQRISIARAILKNAPILLLDEATSSLDAETEKEINISLQKLTKNKTTITVAHKLSTVVKADQIILFDKGKVVGSGTHLELIEKSSLYKKLYNLNKLN
ncbi:MAG: ABC transporter ATP-binding protein [Proteobacteria bacterium]|jgi:ATP-binding cassette, subfamily B, bacterial MsbA|nr:ABC transporter ATP-binding protein [Pseudomonadota bacterium]MDA1135868.1 ABC transporter ATP-binding protein [Pseudomonadota bacterium]|tara:strand:- start:2404 stop:4170 length:1767 start_codon:yes stop_codon:yes gene_type:complete